MDLLFDFSLVREFLEFLVVVGSSKGFRIRVLGFSFFVYRVNISIGGRNVWKIYFIFLNNFFV